MIHESQVKAKIASVLQGEISIIDFARWIMSNSWNMHQDSSPSAVSLVSRVHLLLAERDEQAINDSKFIEELRSIQAEFSEQQLFQIVVRISVDRVSAANYAWPIASANQIIQFPPVVLPLQA